MTEQNSTSPQKKFQLVNESLRPKRMVKPSPMVYVSEIKIPISVELTVKEIGKLSKLIVERMERNEKIATI